MANKDVYISDGQLAVDMAVLMVPCLDRSTVCNLWYTWLWPVCHVVCLYHLSTGGWLGWVGLASWYTTRWFTRMKTTAYLGTSATETQHREIWWHWRCVCIIVGHVGGHVGVNHVSGHVSVNHVRSRECCWQMLCGECVEFSVEAWSHQTGQRRQKFWSWIRCWRSWQVCSVW